MDSKRPRLHPRPPHHQPAASLSHTLSSVNRTFPKLQKEVGRDTKSLLISLLQRRKTAGGNVFPTAKQPMPASDLVSHYLSSPWSLPPHPLSLSSFPQPLSSLYFPSLAPGGRKAVSARSLLPVKGLACLMRPGRCLLWADTCPQKPHVKAQMPSTSEYDPT